MARRLTTKHNWNVIIKLAESLDTGDYFMFDVIEHFHLKLEMTDATVC